MLITSEQAQAGYQRDLGAGLRLRWSTQEDTEQIVQQVGRIFREKADEPVNEHIQTVVRHLMRGNHPLMGTGDYAIVEDTQRTENPIIAGICLQRQHLTYEGIPLRMGRPEIVFNDADYRRRGLIRALFEVIHARSEAEGHHLQAITGINYFYRQFGYEYAADLGGLRGTYLSLIPKPKEGEQEAYTLREATVEEIPIIQRLYEQRRTRTQSIVWTVVPDAYWRNELEGWKAMGEENRLSKILLIVDAQREAKGYVLVGTKRRRKILGVWDLEIEQGCNLQVVLPALLRALQAYGLQMPTIGDKVDALSEIHFFLGREHPLYNVLGRELAPIEEEPYSWYIRVPHLPTFLLQIAPALEKRLAQSPVAGYTGEVKIDFYRGGLKLLFEQGRLQAAEDWVVPTYDGGAMAGFPPLLFLQVVFGHRSLDELRRAFPDIWVSNEGRVLLSSLFPARPSALLPL